MGAQALACVYSLFLLLEPSDSPRGTKMRKINVSAVSQEYKSLFLHIFSSGEVFNSEGVHLNFLKRANTWGHISATCPCLGKTTAPSLILLLQTFIFCFSPLNLLCPYFPQNWKLARRDNSTFCACTPSTSSARKLYLHFVFSWPVSPPFPDLWTLISLQDPDEKPKTWKHNSETDSLELKSGWRSIAGAGK